MKIKKKKKEYEDKGKDEEKRDRKKKTRRNEVILSGCRERSNVISPNHSRGVSLVCYVLYVCSVGGIDIVAS